MITSYMSSPDILPKDVEGKISSFLCLKDLSSLSSTSKVWNKYFVEESETYKARKLHLFRHKFGALASHESFKDIDSLATKILEIRKVGEAKPSQVLKFVKGLPVMVESPRDDSPKTWWQKTKMLYAEWHFDIKDKITEKEVRNIFSEHAKVLKDLMKKSIDKTESLQDYRDRLLRYRVIYVERYLLLRALSEKERARREVSFPENDLFYREIESNHLTANEMRLYNLVNSVNKEIELTIKDLAIAFIYSLAFKFFWFFHSFFKSSIFYDFPSTNYAKEIIGLKHCHVDLTSNVIDFNGEPTEVQIEAGLARDRVDYHTNVMNYNRSDILFSIVNSTTGECIGRLIIERSKNVKEELKIVLDLVRFKNRNKSPSLNMMLLQLAMEIFSREPQRKLNLGINSCNSCVLSVSGVFHDTKLRNQVLKERQAKKVLFPEGDFINGSCTIIKNSDDSHKTKFCSLNAGNINRNPMVVEFSLDGTSNTWEEIIEKKPLLKGGSNRILWEFLGEDLSKLNDF